MLLTTKLKLAALLPASALLFACASGTVPYQNTQPHITQNPNGAPALATNSYSCNDNSSIYAQYSPNGEQAMLSITAPKVKWVNQPMTLNVARSGSGMRYVNNASPNVTHEWQSNGRDGVLTINWTTGEEYSVVCQKTM